MCTSVVLLAFFPLVAEMVPLDPQVYPDDFVSVSCPVDGHCLFLDNAHNLLFSSDGGASLAKRASHRSIDLVKIRFNGLIDGWGLDSRGGLWRSINGGRIFNPVSRGKKSRAVDLAVAPEGIWVAGLDESLYLVSPGGKIIESVRVPEQPGSLAVSASGLLVLMSRDGSLLTSADRGRTWSKQPLSKAAVRVGDFLSEGRLLVFDKSGRALLGDPGTGKFQEVALDPEEGWKDACRTPAGLILAGQTGMRLQLSLDPKGRFIMRTLGKRRPEVTDIQFLDRRHLVVAFRNGEINSSADGGIHFETVGRLSPGPNRISFTSLRRGYALVGPHLIMGTSDGGRNWQRLGYWADLYLNHIFFVDRIRGWAVGRNGCVVSTRDGGQSWTITRLLVDATLNRVHFISAREGWVIGDGHLVFQTRDGGLIWQKKLIGRGTLFGAHFDPSGAGWIAGDSGAILHTQDGGETWTPQSLPSSETMRTVFFLDRRRGLVVGDHGRAFITKNGGQVWKPLDLSTRVKATVVACHRKSARCLIGGERGLLVGGSPFRFLP